MRFFLLSLTVLLLSACSTAPVLPIHVPATLQVFTKKPEPRFSQEGRASWYGNKHHGKKTANGERFDQHALTAAHRTLPFGSRILVTNLSNQRSVVVRINDRGPYSRNRILDVSRQAAHELDMLKAGVVQVHLQTLDE